MNEGLGRLDSMFVYVWGMNINEGEIDCDASDSFTQHEERKT